ncbi:hypothetical protein QUA13_29930 [Microcoleus sp. S28C3]|uniref:hypothetical protein n=1 Tax=Microcoleus sp. S28C3 TaxID=3055414 RepID=UPI002FD1489E
MTESVRAVRASVQIGSLTVDGFMLPDGSYRMSQTQAAETIDEPPVYALRFLRSNGSKALLGEAYTDYTPESVEVESELGQRGQTRINALPLNVVTAYWLTRAYKGNRKAFLLSWALLTESLERRFDEAFGVTRTETERNDLLSQRVLELEQNIREAFWVEDEARAERDYFERLLRENGIDPWRIPGAEDEPD